MFRAQFFGFLLIFILVFFTDDRLEPRRPPVLRRGGVAEHLRLPREDQEGPRATRDVLRLQVGGRLPLQGAAETEEKVSHRK